MNVSKGIYDANIKECTHRVDFPNGVTFNNVRNIKKYKNCDESNCRHYSRCCSTGGPVRHLECKKNYNKLKFVYVLASAVPNLAVIYYLLFLSNYSFATNLIIWIVSFIILDIIFCIFEGIVSTISDLCFFFKLRSLDKKQKILQEQEYKAAELKKELDYIEFLKKDNNYSAYFIAESFVNDFKRLLEFYDFGSNLEKIKSCISELEEILFLLKDKPSNYGRVSFLFEICLPSYYNSLKFYIKLKSSDSKIINYDKIIEKCIDNFLIILRNQKIEVASVERSIESNFKRSVASISTLIKDEKENEYED